MITGNYFEGIPGSSYRKFPEKVDAIIIIEPWHNPKITRKRSSKTIKSFERWKYHFLQSPGLPTGLSAAH